MSTSSIISRRNGPSESGSGAPSGGFKGSDVRMTSSAHRSLPIAQTYWRSHSSMSSRSGPTATSHASAGVLRRRPWFVRRSFAEVRDARTPTGERTDPVDGFTRTTLIVGPAGGDEHGSVDVVTPEGVRLGQINVFATKDGDLMVDVIDIDKRFKIRRAITFPNGGRESIEAGTIVAAHFEVGT